EVRLPLLSTKEDGHHRLTTAVCLDPTLGSFVDGASPKANRIGPQSGVGQFQRDAANVFVCEEIGSSELHLVDQAVCVEEEGIAAPTCKEMVFAGGCHQGFPSG